MSKTYDELKRAEQARLCPNMIGSDIHIHGDVLGGGDLIVEGTIEGFIDLGDGRLTVGSAARVIADIVAREVIVLGEVQGNISVRDRIEIRSRGLVRGDLSTARILIDEGANFKGSMEIISSPTAPKVVAQIEPQMISAIGSPQAEQQRAASFETIRQPSLETSSPGSATISPVTS